MLPRMVHAADAGHMRAAREAFEKSGFATPEFTRGTYLRFSLLISPVLQPPAYNSYFHSQITRYAVIRLTKRGDGRGCHLKENPSVNLVCLPISEMMK